MDWWAGVLIVQKGRMDGRSEKGKEKKKSPPLGAPASPWLAFWSPGLEFCAFQ